MHNYYNIYTKDRNYQAIIQLRPRNQNLLNFVKEQISKDKNTFITKEIEKNYGYDLYLTSFKILRPLSNLLKRRFKGDVIVSKKLYSRDRQRSKNLYRVTLLFRLNQ